jgi:hypothetical protein
LEQGAKSKDVRLKTASADKPLALIDERQETVAIKIPPPISIHPDLVRTLDWQGGK